MKQYAKKRLNRASHKHLNSNIKYPDFMWTDVGSEEYLNAIDDINDLYRKMLEIGKAAEVFHDKECPMMSAKTKKEFQKHRDSMRRNYTSIHQNQNWAIFALTVKYYHTLTSMGEDLQADFQPTGK